MVVRKGGSNRILLAGSPVSLKVKSSCCGSRISAGECFSMGPINPGSECLFLLSVKQGVSRCSTGVSTICLD